MSERLYTRLYWSSQQQGRAINGTGALGAEFEVQWELIDFNIGSTQQCSCP